MYFPQRNDFKTNCIEFHYQGIICPTPEGFEDVLELLQAVSNPPVI